MTSSKIIYFGAYVPQDEERGTGVRTVDGKVVVITGGSRGLGKLLAQQFASDGARV
ncbi:unnamed protein product, partial [marine sediment metagenome]